MRGAWQILSPLACFTETRPGGKIVEKLHPIAYASKHTSLSEAHYKPFLLEFAALKFTLDKFDIIWGFPIEIETDCQALRDVAFFLRVPIA